MNSYNLGAGSAATENIFPQHPNASELLREYVDKVGAQQQQDQSGAGDFPGSLGVNKTANFSVSHLLDLEELPRENCAMFAATALDGSGGGGGLTADGVALRLQRPDDANSPMDSACCGHPGGNGAGNAGPNNRTPDDAQTQHKQHSGKTLGVICVTGITRIRTY